MAAKLKLVTPDLLSETQRKYFDKYNTQAPAQGVCVNVAIGSEPWDIRPLYLERTRVWLHRYTRPLDPDVVREASAEWAGFTVITDLNLQVSAPEHLDQLLTIRPYFQSTLTETLRDGHLDDSKERRSVARLLVQQVGILIKRNLVHGHISPSNVAVHEGKIVLLDPRISFLNARNDEFTAPEIQGLGSREVREPPPSVDLYGLGRVLSQLLADSASREEQELIEQLTLPSPRQRPPYSLIEEVIGTPDTPLRVVKGGKKINVSLQREVLQDVSTKGRLPLLREGEVFSRYLKNITWKNSALALGAVAMGLLLLQKRFPHLYNETAHYIPLLASDRNPEFEVAWASGERSKMAAVAREAVLARDPAAENAIIQQVLSGEKLSNPQLDLLKRILDPLWRDDLSRKDIRAALCIALAPLVPEALNEVPPLASLHPAILFSVAGAAGAKDPTKPPVGIRGVELSRLSQLPEPIGEIFENFSQSGVKGLDTPQGLGLASIASGVPSAPAVEGYFTGADSVEVALARLALVYPILTVHREMADEVFVALRDSNGPLGEALGWFDVEPVAKWSDVPSWQKLGLVLGKFPPPPGFDLARYCDLLKFPLASVRKGAADVLAAPKLFSQQATNMLSFLSGDQNRLSRSQVVSLLSALSLKSELGSSFISTWFTTIHPDPTSVLMVLLARSNYSTEDIFNLEAASFLRKVEWETTTDMLQLLARHPEPLARSLAYARLENTNPQQLAILQERLKSEPDPTLKKSIELRVYRTTKPGAPISSGATVSPHPVPKPAIVEATIPPGMEKVL